MQNVTPFTEQNCPILVLAGPTAIGKTELALNLAEEFDGEIIGMDSMQVYTYMDIGTAKPTKEERQRAVHHLVDYVDPAETYNAARFLTDAGRAVREIRGRGRLPMMVGGTGLYMKTFFEGVFEIPRTDPEIRQHLKSEVSEKGTAYLHAELTACDPVSAARIHSNDTNRLVRALEIFRGTGRTWSSFIEEHQMARSQAKAAGTAPLKIGLLRPRQELYDRINLRVDIMLEQGVLQEVENLLEMGYSPELNSMQSLGYRHMVNYIKSVWSWQESRELLARDTRHYAKRQMTWFNRDQDMLWYGPQQQNEIFSEVRGYLKKNMQQAI